MHTLSRRNFIIQSSMIVAGASSLLRPDETMPDPVVKTMHASPEQLVDKAIEMLGGIETFVKPGQSVLIKPNIGWDRAPEQAATTNPDIVSKIITLCRQAGAGKIRVLDRTCNSARRCYRRSGIADAAKQAGAQVRYTVTSRFRDTTIPEGRILKSWPIYKDVFDFDLLINIPIAKTHSLSRVTLGMKNLMGLLGGDRGRLHEDFDEKIVDINSIIRPTLTIVDAYRVLLRNGPSGGSLDDVSLRETIIAGRDPVAVDAAAALLFNIAPSSLPYLVNAERRGLGSMNLGVSKLKLFDFRG